MFAISRLRELCDEHANFAAIAERLNAEGFRPPKRTARFSDEMVRRLAINLGLTRRAGSGNGLGADEYRPMDLARRLAVGRDTIRSWLRAGWLTHVWLTRRSLDASGEQAEENKEVPLPPLSRRLESLRDELRKERNPSAC